MGTTDPDSVGVAAKLVLAGSDVGVAAKLMLAGSDVRVAVIVTTPRIVEVVVSIGSLQIELVYTVIAGCKHRRHTSESRWDLE